MCAYLESLVQGVIWLVIVLALVPAVWMIALQQGKYIQHIPVFLGIQGDSTAKGRDGRIFLLLVKVNKRQKRADIIKLHATFSNHLMGQIIKLGIVGQACNPSICKAKAGRSL